MGKNAITPNIHLYLHIKECVENYGSIYGFWLFIFKRFNGILGSDQTNGRGIMRKFTTSGVLSKMKFFLPKQYEEFFLEQCKTILSTKSAGVCEVVEPFDLEFASTGPLAGKESVWSNLTSLSPLHRHTNLVFRQ